MEELGGFGGQLLVELFALSHDGIGITAGFGVAAAEHQGVVGGGHQAPGLLAVDAVGHGDEVFHHSSAEFFHISLGVAVAAHAVVAQGSVAFVPQFFAHGVPQVDHLVVNGVELLLMLLIPSTLGFPGGQAAGIVGVVFEGRELA